MLSLAGNDTVYGQKGKDTLQGDAGNDALYGGDGNDLIWGGAGNDFLHGGRGSNTVYGEAGDDTLVVRVVVVDTVTGNNASEFTGNAFDGGAGFDTLRLDVSIERADGQPGLLTVDYSKDVATIEWLAADPDDDPYLWPAGTAKNIEKVDLSKAGAECHYIGGDHDMTVIGSAHGDNFEGGSGNEIFNSGEGWDYFSGGPGNDLFITWAGENDDWFNVKPGDDHDTITGWGPGDKIRFQEFTGAGVTVTKSETNGKTIFSWTNGSLTVDGVGIDQINESKGEYDGYEIL